MRTPILMAALAAAPALAEAQESMTRNCVGPEDEPDALTIRLTAYDLYSSDPVSKATFEELFSEFIR